MKISDFDYFLPPELIAQTPIEPRDHSRLMVVNRAKASIEHHFFFHIVNYLNPGDALVFNDSRVIPARLFGYTETGNQVEILLLRRQDNGNWEIIGRPGKKLKPGVKIKITKPSQPDLVLMAEIIDRGKAGTRIARFSDEEVMERLGEIPLPPYIHSPITNPDRYQTIYAKVKGSVAAPTAGLHFTPRLLEELKNKQIQLIFVTLHIGLDTFRPVREEDPKQHPIHQEYGIVGQEAAQSLNQAKKEGKRIIAVGTSTVRLLEASVVNGELKPFSGLVDLFILPGYQFRFVDAMITNFHLPRSTLLLLVSAFAGRELILKAYQEAVKQKYRFYTFGDAMLIL